MSFRKLKLNTAIPLLCLVTLLMIQLNASALTANAPSINVLELPTPQIANIDPTTGIVTLAPPELDPEVSAELQAIISLYDGETPLETAKVSIIDRTASIKIPLKTPLKTGYKITPQFINHEVISGGADDSVSEKATSEPTPTPTSPIVIGGSSSSSTKTVYVVQEVKPENVVIEKVVEVIKPATIESKVTSFEQPQSIESSDADTLERVIIRPTEPQIIPLKAVIPDITNDITALSTFEKIIFALLVALCVALLIIIILMIRKLFLSKGSRSNVKEDAIIVVEQVSTVKRHFSLHKRFYAYTLAALVVIGSYIHVLPKHLKKYQVVKENTKLESTEATDYLENVRDDIPSNKDKLGMETKSIHDDLNYCYSPFSSDEFIYED